MDILWVFFRLVFAMPLYASAYMCLVVTCWERADLLALVCERLTVSLLLSHWYPSFLVSIPDLCTLTYLNAALPIIMPIYARVIGNQGSRLCFCFENVFPETLKIKTRHFIKR